MAEDRPKGKWIPVIKATEQLREVTTEISRIEASIYARISEPERILRFLIRRIDKPVPSEELLRVVEETLTSKTKESRKVAGEIDSFENMIGDSAAFSDPSRSEAEFLREIYLSDPKDGLPDLVQDLIAIRNELSLTGILTEVAEVYSEDRNGLDLSK